MILVWQYYIRHNFCVQIFSRFWTRCGNSRGVDFTGHKLKWIFSRVSWPREIRKNKTTTKRTMYTVVFIDPIEQCYQLGNVMEISIYRLIYIDRNVYKIEQKCWEEKYHISGFGSLGVIKHYALSLKHSSGFYTGFERSQWVFMNMPRDLALSISSPLAENLSLIMRGGGGQLYNGIECMKC